MDENRIREIVREEIKAAQEERAADLAASVSVLIEKKLTEKFVSLKPIDQLDTKS